MASLSSLVHTGRSVEPLRILLHGVEGVGKTTFASGAPGGISIGPEDGGGDIDMPRITVTTWEGLLTAIKALIDDDHDYRVAVLDTLDFIERLCHLHITKGTTSMEKAEGGYGKAYKMAAEEMGKFIALLDVLRTKRRVAVIAIVHTEIKKFDDPTDASYDRYQIRLHKDAAGLWSGWADCVLFANYDIKVRVASGGNGPEILKKGKAVDKAPDRILYTERRPAFDAKNRYNLPFEIPLSWADFATEIKWDERDARCRNKPAPVVPDLTPEQVRGWAMDALRNRDWLPEQIEEVCTRYGVTKPQEIPPPNRREAVAIFRGPTPTTHNSPEAK